MQKENNIATCVYDKVYICNFFPSVYLFNSHLSFLGSGDGIETDTARSHVDSHLGSAKINTSGASLCREMYAVISLLLL